MIGVIVYLLAFVVRVLREMTLLVALFALALVVGVLYVLRAMIPYLLRGTCVVALVTAQWALVRTTFALFAEDGMLSAGLAAFLTAGTVVAFGFRYYAVAPFGHRLWVACVVCTALTVGMTIGVSALPENAHWLIPCIGLFVFSPLHYWKGNHHERRS